MADNLNLVSVLGVLLVLTIFHNPIIVYAGEGVPNVALFTFGDSYYDAGNKVFSAKGKIFHKPIGPTENPATTPTASFPTATSSPTSSLISSLFRMEYSHRCLNRALIFHVESALPSPMLLFSERRLNL